MPDAKGRDFERSVNSQRATVAASCSCGDASSAAPGALGSTLVDTLASTSRQQPCKLLELDSCYFEAIGITGQGAGVVLRISEYHALHMPLALHSDAVSADPSERVVASAAQNSEVI